MGCRVIGILRALAIQHRVEPRDAVLWQERALLAGCKRHCVEWGGTAPSPTPDARVYFEAVDLDTGHIGSLPLPILEDILGRLDLPSRFSVKRVCALWQDVLEKPSTNRHLLIDARTLQVQAVATTFRAPGCWKWEYLLVVLLEESITILTRTITYICQSGDKDSHRFLTHIVHLLSLKATKLDTILIKDGELSIDIWQAHRIRSQFMIHWTSSSYLDEFRPLCQHLIVVNCTLCGVLESPNRSSQLSCDPVYSKMGVVRHDPLMNAELSLKAVVSWLVIGCSDSKSQMLRTILLASEKSFPPVEQIVSARCAAVHKRMLTTLTYPDDWKGIRTLLQIYNGFWPDGSTRNWDDVDLRDLDISCLTNMTLRVLDAVFRL
ncbi:uncharacterized protein LOC129597866 isoform X2 [Paramacrobiotus metropolitanus]|uniref:uncharacterized protein LOC129597866 isoform X2 n=1 Tax=Paramacrobiotus metropolitanus TaxID=2943436 RepID=UPI002445F71E|nr:uncharacterized protein LOC129597866 isoform X2 [Paramacrobiotus metropolitanus]